MLMIMRLMVSVVVVKITVMVLISDLLIKLFHKLEAAKVESPDFRMT